MAKVYVSSTIADLERERRAVLDWLRLARHQAAGSYLPGSDTVRDGCLDDVAGWTGPGGHMVRARTAVLGCLACRPPAGVARSL